MVARTPIPEMSGFGTMPSVPLQAEGMSGGGNEATMLTFDAVITHHAACQLPVKLQIVYYK